MRFSIMPIMLFLLLAAAPSWSQNASLYGYGVRSCDDLVASAKQWESEKEDAGALAYVQLREWMSGFISGLSLALGNDVTRGAGVEGMIRQVVKQCTDHRQSDVFTTTMELIRKRGGLE